VGGTISITFPIREVLEDDKAVADIELMENYEACIESWTKTISTTL